MRICVVGGSGFVGTRLIDLLQGSEYDLLNIDQQISNEYPQITQVVDIRDEQALNDHLKNQDVVVLLAAVHRDDITPKSLYYDINVTGLRNVLQAMDKNHIKRLVFTSSVAVYGMNKDNPGEEDSKDPFNDYGKSKLAGEIVLREWYEKHPEWNIEIVRPTVIFGERNRGNVYNLLREIVNGHFLMVGDGKNMKSMCYVGNVAAFLKYLIENRTNGFEVFNYIDKPDLTTNELISLVEEKLNLSLPSVHIPYWIGLMGGYCFDLLASITRKKMIISSVRVKKFCATTQFDITKIKTTDFIPPYTLQEGLERTLNFEFGKMNLDASDENFSKPNIIESEDCKNTIKINKKSEPVSKSTIHDETN